MKPNPTSIPATYNRVEAQRTLNPRYMTVYHQHAQWAELLRLKEIIGELHSYSKHPLRILDIGVGFGRIPRLLSRVDTWKKISRYIGIDNSKFSVNTAKRIMKSIGIADKVNVILFDGTNLCTSSDEILLKERFDAVLCTYFTAGDFQPDEIALQTAENGMIAEYDVNVLKPNKRFVAVFEGAYRLLRDNGKIIIGSVYCDTDLARRVQEDFYQRCGMTVITTSKDSFTATSQGFWSQRFDKHRIYKYLSWVPNDKIRFLPLDDYEFALAVVVDR